MKRRAMLQALGAMSIYPLGAAEGLAMNSAESVWPGNSPAMSPRNSTATVEQLAMEDQAMRILQAPVAQAAIRTAATRLRTLGAAAASEEAWREFDEHLQEWGYEMILKAICADSNYPRLLHHMYGPAHEWFGRKVPASIGFGGDNVDVIYSIFALDPHSHFELRGRRMEPAITDGLIEVCGNLSLAMSLGHVDWRDVEFDADGRFSIRFGPEPANGRRNYIQLKRDARFGFMRNARADWAEMPPTYHIERLDPPTAPPMSDEEIAARAALYIVDDIPATHYWVAMINAMPVNTLVSPSGGSVIVGGLQQRQMAFGRLRIEDDEAFVVKVGSGGADYRGLIVMDYWMHSLDAGRRNSSLSSGQSVANPDGSFTYVVCADDPGVHNWLDCVGLREPKVMHRWHLLPRDPGPAVAPWIEGRVIKRKDLDAVLPPGTLRVTPAERKLQLAERAKFFNLRFAEH